MNEALISALHGTILLCDSSVFSSLFPQMFVLICLFPPFFVSMCLFSSLFERPAFCLSLSCPFLLLLFKCSYCSPCICLSTCPFLLYSSLQQNVLFPHIHPSLWPLSYLFSSITFSLLCHPSLPPEIITTSPVKISLHLNSWISKAWGCWQSLFNNNIQVKRWSTK